MEDEVKNDFRAAFINAVEAVIEHKMNPSGISVLTSYFNDEKGDTTLERSIQAMERYMQKPLPSSEERTKKMKEALNILAYAAKNWDAT